MPTAPQTLEDEKVLDFNVTDVTTAYKDEQQAFLRALDGRPGHLFESTDAPGVFVVITRKKDSPRVHRRLMKIADARLSPTSIKGLGEVRVGVHRSRWLRRKNGAVVFFVREGQTFSTSSSAPQFERDLAALPHAP